MHFTDFLRAQLQRADVAAQPPANLVWLDAPLAGFSLPERYAVLIPASAPGGEYKRWPAGHYAALAKRLGERGITSLVAGARQDGNTTAKVVSLATPHAIDFAGHTDLFELAAVMRRALCVIGNDTGPMHMAAALGAPTLALLSGHTDPAWSAPKPPRGAWRQAEPLSALDPAQVLLALDGLLDTNAESMETPDRNRA